MKTKINENKRKTKNERGPSRPEADFGQAAKWRQIAKNELKRKSTKNEKRKGSRSAGGRISAQTAGFWSFLCVNRRQNAVAGPLGAAQAAGPGGPAKWRQMAKTNKNENKRKNEKRKASRRNPGNPQNPTG